MTILRLQFNQVWGTHVHQQLKSNWRQKVEQKLEELVSQDIIEPVQGPTLYVSPFVMVLSSWEHQALCRHESGLVGRLSLHTSEVTHQPGAYLSFCSMKRLRVLYSSLDGILVHHRVIPSIKFAGIHLYTRVERGIVRVNWLAEEQGPGLEHGPLDLETSALTMRLLHLP